MGSEPVVRKIKCLRCGDDATMVKEPIESSAGRRLSWGLLFGLGGLISRGTHSTIACPNCGTYEFKFGA